MVSWLEEIERREAATREEIGELRARLEELTERLAEQETVLSRLEITRETMTEILSGGEAVTEPRAGVESGEAGVVEASGQPAMEEESRFFVLMACSTWTDRPDLRAECLQGYGRNLTVEEQHALKCLAAIDAVSCLVWGPKLDDPHLTARGRRTLDRLMAGVFA